MRGEGGRGNEGHNGLRLMMVDVLLLFYGLHNTCTIMYYFYISPEALKFLYENRTLVRVGKAG